eukprot:Skav215119  [mRNA]  locus=scaffold1893:350912:352273:- [translate_table: standard]
MYTPLTSIPRAERKRDPSFIYLREPENYLPDLNANPLQECDVIRLIEEGGEPGNQTKRLQLTGFDVRVTGGTSELIGARSQELMTDARGCFFCCRRSKGYDSHYDSDEAQYHLFVHLTTHSNYLNQLSWSIFQAILLAFNEATSFNLILTDHRKNYIIVWFLALVGYFLYCLSLAELQLNESGTDEELEWYRLNCWEKFWCRMQYLLFNWFRADRLLIKTIQKVHPAGATQGRAAFRVNLRRAFLSTYIGRAHHDCDSKQGYQQLYLGHFLRKGSMLVVSVKLCFSDPTSSSLTLLSIVGKLLLLGLTIYQYWSLLRSKRTFAKCAKHLCESLGLSDRAEIRNWAEKARSMNENDQRKIDLAKLMVMHFRQHPKSCRPDLESLNPLFSCRHWQNWWVWRRQELGPNAQREPGLRDGEQFFWWFPPLSQMCGFLLLVAAFLFSITHPVSKPEQA